MITSTRYSTGSGCITRLPPLVLSTCEKCFTSPTTQCLRLLRSKLAHHLASDMEDVVEDAAVVAVTVAMNTADLVREEADSVAVSVDAEGVASVVVVVAVEVAVVWEVKLLLLKDSNFKMKFFVESLRTYSHLTNLDVLVDRPFSARRAFFDHNLLRAMMITNCRVY
mmetsp:Transcript_24985/g.34876  ORF Transcript_24985/g.34876 Transcript_24985/m.34876 type:complete len:167 (+) Transcript_24985:194-694(+)